MRALTISLIIGIVIGAAYLYVVPVLVWLAIVVVLLIVKGNALVRGPVETAESDIGLKYVLYLRIDFLFGNDAVVDKRLDGLVVQGIATRHFKVKTAHYRTYGCIV